MAGLVSCTVDPGGTGDYTSLSGAIAGAFGATSADLEENEEWVECECICTNGNADTTQIDLGGFSTTATYDIYIYTPETYRHDGTFPSSGNYYRLDVSSTRCVDFYSSYITFEGMAVRLTCSGNASYQSRCLTATNIIVDRCVWEMDANGNTGHRILTWYGGGPWHVRHSLFYGCSGNNSQAIRIRVAAGTTNWLDNLTVCKSEDGIYRSDANGTILLRNTISYGNTLDYGTDYAFDTGSVDNGYVDADPGTSGVDLSAVDDADLFADYDGDDYHLVAGAAVIDEGTDLSGSIPAYDIDYDSRSGTWDIGADEYVTSGASASGAVTTAAVTVSATATVTRIASGAAATGAVTVSATAAVAREASGAVATGAVTVAGTAVVEHVASGAAATGAVTVAGTASVSSEKTASGAITTGAVTASGDASVAREASGAVTTGAVTASGTAAVAREASGAVATGAVTASGTASVARESSGAATLGSVTVSATAAVTSGVTASGAVSAPATTVEGTATVGRVASGAAATGAVEASGTATVGRVASGAVDIPAATAVGTATVEGGTEASGAATTGTVTVAGTAVVGRVASGAITTGAVTVVGTIDSGEQLTLTQQLNEVIDLLCVLVAKCGA